LEREREREGEGEGERGRERLGGRKREVPGSHRLVHRLLIIRERGGRERSERGGSSRYSDVLSLRARERERDRERERERERELSRLCPGTSPAPTCPDRMGEDPIGVGDSEQSGAERLGRRRLRRERERERPKGRGHSQRLGRRRLRRERDRPKGRGH
jgi:hypothetical protein